MALSDFTQYALEGVSINNPTSVEFGADGRLYVTQQDGLIKALEIAKKVDGGYAVVDEEIITLVKTMPNHNDDGTIAADINEREVTGVVTTTNALGQMVLYVSSSDSRIAGGSSGDDSDLDTNSSIISRLTLTDTGWVKVDIVRGLPRSEENHAANGMQLTEINGVPTLLVAVGGITNSGAQGNNFSHTNEYYYSGAIVSIDLEKIADLEAQGLKTYAPPGYAPQSYVFDLPTLDDPTRPNDVNGKDISGNGIAGGDPFGGNDGLNQAIYDTSGTVKIFSPGYRNAYDIVITQDGKLYTYDNGPNASWGGMPVNANGELIVDLNKDGIPDNGPAVTLHDAANPGNIGVSKPDQLHLIDTNIADGLTNSYIDGTPYNTQLYFAQGLGYYGGHPNVTRAYGTQAGLYLYNEAGQPLTIVNGALVVSATGPVDLGPMIANWGDIVGSDAEGNEFIDPRQAIYLSPKPNDGNLPFDGSLHSIASSTNGLTEYTWSGDELQHALLTVSFNGNLTALNLDAEGRVISTETRGIGGNPLDVTTQGNNEIFAGTIWIATHGSDKIFILDPEAGTGITPDPTDRDLDDVEDTFDPFAADPTNGMANVINGNETLVWEFISGAPLPNDRPDFFDGASGLYNGFDIGFTGIMTDGTGLPESFYDNENLIAGGAPGAFQIKRVEAGNPFDDTQRGAYQFGVTPGADTGIFTVSTLMDSFFDEIAGVPAGAKLVQGMFAGSGDMDNFVYIAAVKLPDGTTGIEVAWEFERPFQPNGQGTAFYRIDALASATSTDSIKVSLEFDTATGIVTPHWTYTSGGQTFTEAAFGGTIETVQLEGTALAALTGTNELDLKSGGTVPSALAVGILASNSSAEALQNNVVAAVNAGGNDYTAIVGGESVTFLSDKPGGAANGWITGTGYRSFEPAPFNIDGTELDVLHQSERSQTGTWGYAVPVSEGGLFDIDLYMAEIFYGAPGGGAGGPDARLFRIKIEGQYVTIPGSPDGLLDIYELSGGAAKELLLSYEVQERANDGNSTLDIEFESVTGQAKVSGFIIREIEASETFAADWENIIITGEQKDLSGDTTPPVVTIDVQSAPAGDAQFVATVVFTDTIAMNLDSIGENDLIMSGPSSNELLDFQKSISADGKTVTAVYSFGSTSGGWVQGNYSFTVAAGAASDAAGNPVILTVASAPFGTPDEVLDRGAFVLAVNFNGGAITAEDGITYQADDDNNNDGTAWLGSYKYVDGQFGDTVSPITNVEGPMEAEIYKTARYGGKATDFSYTISQLEANTQYVLTLKFAEIWYLHSTPGKRVFDVLVNNALVIDNLDLMARAGMHIAFDKDVLVTSDANGVIKITMPVTADNAQIAAIALHKAPEPADQGPTAVMTHDVPDSADEALVVTVVYRDANGIDATTVDVSDIVLTGATASSVTVSFDPLTSTAIYTFMPPAGGWTDGAYSVQLAAGAVADGSAAGNESLAGTPVNFNLDFPNSPQPELDKGSLVMAVNFNGGAVTTEDGITYQADEDNSTDGTAWIGSHKISDGQFGDTLAPTTNAEGPLDASLYNTARYGGKNTEFSYVISNLAANTQYVLTMKFAEIWHLNSTPGKRVFDVIVNNVVVLDDLDLVTEAGLHVAFDKDVIVTSDANGVIKLTMPASVDNAQIAAIAIHNLPGIDNQGPTAVLSHNLPQNADAPLVVTVTYHDDSGVNSSSIDASDILLTGATASSVTVSYNAATAVAVYTFQPPAGGWGEGGYSVQLAAGSVSDTSTPANTNTAGLTQAFTLDFPNIPPPGDLDKGTLVLAVNFNGGAVTTEDGITYQADEDIGTDGTAWIGSHKISDGLFGDTVAPITNAAGPLDASLYTTARYGGKSTEFSYAISNLEANTQYVLTLKFVEIWYLNSTAGKRVFDVLANGQIILDNLDLTAQAGLHSAFDRDVIVTSDANGVIKLTMPASVDNAQIAAIALHNMPAIDDQGPVASLSYTAPASEDAALVVAVVYQDASGINAASVDASDIVVTGPSSAGSPAVSYDTETSTALYTFQPPAGGWSDGIYSVQLASGAVSDNATPANASAAVAPQSFALDFPEGPGIGTGPSEDFDGDGIINQSDGDIDGDGVLNGDDMLAYDSDDDGHGVTLAAGASLLLDFNVAGTPYQSGFTGVMASSNPAFKAEDTGSGVVSGGKLHVTTTNGDTGSANTPQNGYQVGIRNASFTVEAQFDNPYFNTGEVPNNYEQLGLQVSLHSDAFVKFVFGSPGANIEFSQNSGLALKPAFANGHVLADFASAKLQLAVTTQGTTSTATATITLLDTAGNVIPGGGPTTVGTLTLDPALSAALRDGGTAVGVGVTSTHFGGDAFTWSADDFKIIEGGYQAPPQPDAASILSTQTDIVKTDVYSGTASGAAVLKILAGGTNVQTSNYGGNSFMLQNVGDKKIAGVFLDVRSALYSDSVFDADGSGGDQITKDFAFQTNQATGAILPSTYQHFFYAARDPGLPDPLYNNVYSDSAKGAGGGFRGLLLKFSGNQNGFQIGESVGFSGDMDPNSIAGLLKSTVDGTSVPGWDVGGVSGAELIGARVTIMFSDGTMATGQLMGDGSQAGAQALITQQQGPLPIAHLSVNGYEDGENGTYGGTLPQVIVSGPVGETVRVIMTRGFDPVNSSKLLANGSITVDALVAQRLAAHDFAASNAADFQTVDIVIPAGGSIDISSLFNYGSAPNGNAGIPDYDQLQLGFVAAVIDPDNGSLPIGAVTDPIYLVNNGSPVVAANVAPTDINLSGLLSVTENSAGAVIGTLTAVDANIADNHIFTTDDSRFEIIGNQLKLRSNIALDHELAAATNVAVTATDSGGLSMVRTFGLVVTNDPSDDPTGSTFIASVNGASGDLEQGSFASSVDLETNRIIGIQFTVPAGIDLSSGAFIESAIISWISDRSHTTTNTALTFSVESQLNGAPITTGVTNRSYLPERDIWQAGGSWTDGQKITVGIDLADQLNDLIVTDGLVAGDVITVKVEGTGGTRYIEAAGGNRSGPELAITYVDAANRAFFARDYAPSTFDDNVEDYLHITQSNPVDQEVPDILWAGHETLPSDITDMADTHLAHHFDL
ncbi:malectin domain-containing carbohydrate-binding protein [Neorhizobium sp. BT27B]|uniref:malectin domain-containing carbohydrate-binding protein n=1 Tax=Neorhizobium sp. BT27B TaxID=3142625 RepID=UPI003D2BC837